MLVNPDGYREQIKPRIKRLFWSTMSFDCCKRTGGRGYKALPLGSWRRRHSPVGFPQTAAGL